jgi:hypothetical protein
VAGTESGDSLREPLFHPPGTSACFCRRINTKVQLSASKVVDTCKVADIEVRVRGGTEGAAGPLPGFWVHFADAHRGLQDEGKKVYCRCWKSSTFPLCDGSHGKHNAATGDNVGPLIVSKAK